MNNALGERNLNARFVKSKFEPFPQFTGAIPILQRLRFPEYFDHDGGVGEIIDPDELRG